MLEAPLPLLLPKSSVTSQPKNSGNEIEAQPIGSDEVDGLSSPYSVPENADAGETEHLQHVPAKGAAPVRRRTHNPRVGLGSHVR
jgi:hypothetical protein